MIPPTKIPFVAVPFECCQFYYLSNVAKHCIEIGNIHGTLVGAELKDESRYSCIADWMMEAIKVHDVKSVGIEGYAFSANSSSLTRLAEGCGLCKWFLHTHAIPTNIYPPTTIKKFATSKGNVDKDAMYLAFVMDTNVSLNSVFGRTEGCKIKSPVHDMVDAYYIACMQRLEMIASNGSYAGEQTEGVVLEWKQAPKEKEDRGTEDE